MLHVLRARKTSWGFSLIEILVAVAILAVVSSVAVPVFLNQKARGYFATAESDATKVRDEILSMSKSYESFGNSGSVTYASSNLTLNVGTSFIGSTASTPQTQVASLTLTEGSTVGASVLYSGGTNFCVKVSNNGKSVVANQAGIQNDLTDCPANLGTATGWNGSGGGGGGGGGDPEVPGDGGGGGGGGGGDPEVPGDGGAAPVLALTGSNNNGQLGNYGTPNPSGEPVAAFTTTGALAGKTITEIGVGSGSACAIADGGVYCWGYGYLSYPRPILSGVVAGKTFHGLSVGRTGVCAIADGEVYCGSVLTKISPGALAGKTVTQVSVGLYVDCALADGDVYCWGRNSEGQLGNGTKNDSAVPVAVSKAGVLAGKTVTQISAGRNFACALASGSAYCWGYGGYGQLGQGYTSSTVPVAVSTAGVLAGKTVTQISTSTTDYDTCAIADGAAYCWGRNHYGQSGNGGTGNLIPVEVPRSGVLAGKTVTQISVGETSVCAIASSRAYCWGGMSGGRRPIAVDTSGVLAGKNVTMVSVGAGSAGFYAVPS
jgi:prepilin-type N-terminal cleavage/methylation domain-containing protein